MQETGSITIRMEKTLLRSLKVSAVMNDRSANKEIVRLLRKALAEEKESK